MGSIVNVAVGFASNVCAMAVWITPSEGADAQAAKKKAIRRTIICNILFAPGITLYGRCRQYPANLMEVFYPRLVKASLTQPFEG